jgi:hypothetical protein
MSNEEIFDVKGKRRIFLPALSAAFLGAAYFCGAVVYQKLSRV